MKASDIKDEDFLEIVRKYNVGDVPDKVTSWENHPEWGERIISGPRWALIWDLEEYFNMPDKVIRAKARSLIERGLMDGCACGCRGDFEVI